jgi:hypothetical protein
VNVGERIDICEVRSIILNVELTKKLHSLELLIFYLLSGCSSDFREVHCHG